jgi:ketosteroid isomerase-like protein
MSSGSIIASTVLALLLMAAPAGRAVAENAEGTIRSTFTQWTKDFNAGKADAVCQLFSPELRYDFRGYPERDYNDVCTLLHRSLADQSKRYVYALDLREIMVSGDLAIVRLAWTLNVTLPNGQLVKSVEPGMDILRKSPEGQWKIIRYIAYEAPERPIDGGQ